MGQKLEEITINMNEFPRAGKAALILRVQPDDFDDVNKAARKLRIKQSEFMRLVIVQAARKVCAAL